MVDLAKLQEMVADVSHHFPLRLPAPTPKALYSPCEIRHLAIIVNWNTTRRRPSAIRWSILTSASWTSLALASSKTASVGSVDLLYRNSWNEVRTLHFNGEQAMIEALKTILGKMHRGCRAAGQRGSVLLQPAPARVDSYPRAAAGLRVYRAASLQYPSGNRAL